METLTAFFIIIFIGLFSGALLRKLHFPWVIGLILGGIVLGPGVFDVLQPDATTEFLGEIGLIFLMFMAGLETKLESFKDPSKKLFALALINGLIPFITGGVIGYLLGYGTTTILLIGIVYLSSSVAVVVPTLESNRLFDLKIGKAVMTTSILQDIASLVALSLVLQHINPITHIPLYLFYPLLSVSIIALRYLIPKIQTALESLIEKKDLFQEELRAVFLILFGTVILFKILGLHSIIAGFFVGLVLSDSVTNEILIGKIRAIAYGLFIPAFFVLIGLNTDFELIFGSEETFAIIGLIVTSSILSKLVSGYIGARMVGFDNTKSFFFGSSSIPQLSTTLAVSYTAVSLGIISPEINTAFVTLSIISTIVGPILMNSFTKKSLSNNKISSILNNIEPNKI